VASDWGSVSAGERHTVAIKTDGTLWAWGNNVFGQLGNGASGVGAYEDKPVSIASPLTPPVSWANVAAGGDYTVATKTNGTLWTWGWNANDRLGRDTTPAIFDHNPERVTIYDDNDVEINIDWRFFAAGHDHALALTASHHLYAWGNNANGAIGSGSLLPPLVDEPLRIWPRYSSFIGSFPGLYYVEASDGTVTIIGYTDHTKETLIIPAEISGMRVTGIRNEAFSGLTNLKRVSIPHTVVIIGDRAFEGCTALTEVYFRHSDARSIVYFGVEVFEGAASTFRIFSAADSRGFTRPIWNGLNSALGNFLATYDHAGIAENFAPVMVRNYEASGGAADYLATINLTTEMISLPDEFKYEPESDPPPDPPSDRELKRLSFSIDGGARWRNIRDYKALERRLPRLLDRGMELWIANKVVPKRRDSGDNTEFRDALQKHADEAIKFPRINPRPRMPRLMIRHINPEQWVLQARDSTVVFVRGIEITDLRPPRPGEALSYGRFPDIGSISVPAFRTQYFVRIAPTFDGKAAGDGDAPNDAGGGTYTPGSRPQRITVRPQYR
jgi:hypothetical protein